MISEPRGLESWLRGTKSDADGEQSVCPHEPPRWSSSPSSHVTPEAGAWASCRTTDLAVPMCVTGCAPTSGGSGVAPAPPAPATPRAAPGDTDESQNVRGAGPNTLGPPPCQGTARRPCPGGPSLSLGYKVQRESRRWGGGTELCVPPGRQAVCCAQRGPGRGGAETPQPDSGTQDGPHPP